MFLFSDPHWCVSLHCVLHGRLWPSLDLSVCSHLGHVVSGVYGLQFRVIHRTDRLVWAFASLRLTSPSHSHIYQHIHSQQHKYWLYQSFISSKKNWRAIIFLLRLPWKTPLITLLPVELSQFRCPGSLLPTSRGIRSSEEHSTGCHLAGKVLTLPSEVRCPCLGGGILKIGSPQVSTSSDDGRSPEGSTLSGGGRVWSLQFVSFLKFFFIKVQAILEIPVITNSQGELLAPWYWRSPQREENEFKPLPVFPEQPVTAGLLQEGMTRAAITVLLGGFPPHPVQLAEIQKSLEEFTLGVGPAWSRVSAQSGPLLSALNRCVCVRSG